MEKPTPITKEYVKYIDSLSQEEIATIFKSCTDSEKDQIKSFINILIGEDYEFTPTKKKQK